MSDPGREIPDFGDRLADLAGAAGRAAVAPQAPAIRQRGRRRVLRRRAAVAALAVVVLTAGAVGTKLIAPTHPPQLPAVSPTPGRTADNSPGPTATPSATGTTPASPALAWCRRPEM